MAKLTYETAQTIVRMLAAKIDRKQISQVTGVKLPQIATIAIASGHGKKRATAGPLLAQGEKGKE